MDLLSLVFSLTPVEKPQPDAVLPLWWGRAAHALLLNTVRRYDERLAEALHSDQGPRPFTASSLMGRFPRGGLEMTGRYTLRFTAIQRELVEILSNAVQAGNPLAPGAIIELDYLRFRIESIQPSSLIADCEIPISNSAIRDPQSSSPNSQSAIPTSQSAIPNPQSATPNPQSAIPTSQSAIPNSQSAIPTSQSAIPNSQSAIRNPQSSWSCLTSYQELSAPYLLAKLTPPRRISLYFTSPTSFKSSEKHVPLPLPELVFNSLLERWNAYAPVVFPAETRRYAAECLAISRYRLSSRFIPVKSLGLRVGGVGEVTFNSLNYDRYWMSVIAVLARFSLFCGVGAGTSMGLGQCRWVEEPANRSNSREG